MKNNLIFNIIKVKSMMERRKNTKKRLNWSKQEDEIILNLSKNLPRKEKWILISKKIKTNSPIECYRRFKSIYPMIKKGRWTPQEDILLMNLVNEFGRCWKFISKIFKNRTNKQVKIRYDEYINPKISSKKFTHAEDQLILELYPYYLNNWSKYQAHLPNRSQRKIKLRCIMLNDNINHSEDHSNSVYSFNPLITNNYSCSFKKLKDEQEINKKKD